MQPTRTHRLLLGVSGLTAIGIGAAILVAPVFFHAGNGIDLGANASLLSEIRAPGGALLVLGTMMLVGVAVSAFTHASTAIAAAVYLAYGASRLLAMALDGLPAPGLIVATGAELAIGLACATVLYRRHRRGGGLVANTGSAGTAA